MLVGGPTSVSNLAEHLGVTQQGASKIVAELTELGCLTARSFPTDRRIRQIALWKRGQEALEAARSARAELDAQLLAILGAKTMLGAKRARAAHSMPLAE